MMLEEFDGKEAQNIYVMPTHANFDTRFTIRQITKQPCKYKADYTESISLDIHPNAIGSKYMADTARNVILKLSS